jgi:glycosyltransferase involved in cell wall biosynthesis
MAADGWNVAQIAFWGLNGYPVVLHGDEYGFPGAKIKIYPKMGDDWGGDAMVFHGKDFGADVTFSMQDVWPLDPNFLRQIKCYIPYTPIDKDPVPPPVLDRLRYAYKIITFSDFGQKSLENSGFASTLIIEGTDPNIFKPMDREQCRKEIGLPQNTFFFGMIAANKENPPRKGFQEALQAFKKFQDAHPDSGILFHCQQPSPTGFPIRAFASHIGIDMSKLFFMEDYKAVYGSDSHTIVKEMNAINVLLHPSQTEGFGLTPVESQSCGVPVIVNNTTSMPELIIDGVTGEMCEATKVGRFTNDLSYVYPADVDSLYQKMETLYTKLQSNENEIRTACRDHVLNKYDINKHYLQKWVPLLEDLQNELLGPVANTQPK